MRRAIAISLLMLFSWTLMAPMLLPGEDANLPACCRGKGICHCRMCKRGDRGGHQKGFAAVAAKCPCCPANACSIQSPNYQPESGSVLLDAATLPLALMPQAEMRCRIPLLRGYPKRGPPTPLA
jgi:hypothetical protein